MAFALLTPATTMASGSPVTTPSKPASFAPNNCQSAFIDHGWVGLLDYAHNASYDVLGAQAAIDPSTEMKPCIDSTGTDGAAASSAWVAVQQATIFSSGNRIVQIGVINCEDATAPTDSPCRSATADTLRYFYAWGRDSGDCGYGSHAPRPIDLGAATLGVSHSFRVRELSGQIKFYIDGVNVKSITDTLCWVTDSTDNQVSFAGERWDGADSLGTASTGTQPRTYFNNMLRLDRSGASETWYTQLVGDGSLGSSGDQASEMDSVGFTTSDDFNIYTTLQ